jgi:valyl-tRNA synthetase
MEVVRSIRNARSEFNVEPGRRIGAIIAAGEYAEMMEWQRGILSALARLDPGQLEIAPALVSKPEGAHASVLDSGIEVYLPLAGMIDLDKERKRIAAELERARSEAGRLESKLNGEFAARAPGEVVERERERLANLNSRLARLEEQLGTLG